MTLAAKIIVGVITIIFLYVIIDSIIWVNKPVGYKYKTPDIPESSIEIKRTKPVLSRTDRILNTNIVSVDDVFNFCKKDIDFRRFEIFCAMLFRELGHKAEITEAKNDYGRDVIVDNNIFIECKQYRSTNSIVGREICQKLLGSMQMHGAVKGIIINTGLFHDNAYEVITKVNNLELWGEKEIKQKLSTLNDTQLKNVVKNTLDYIDTENEFCSLKPEYRVKFENIDDDCELI